MAGAVALVVFLLVLVPLLAMARTVWVEGAGRLDEVVSAPGFTTAVRHTLLLALAVTVLAVPAGTLLGLLLRQPGTPGRTWWQIGVMLPVLVPDFVLGYSWLQAYGRAGFTDDVLGAAWPGVQGPVGVTVAMAVNMIPLAYLVTAVGLAARAEPAAERAARVAGASPASVLGTVVLPLLRPAIATAAVLVFVLSLGAFAIPQVMGTPAGFTTVTTRIYADLARSSDPLAFVDAVSLALLLVVVTFLVVGPADVLLGPRLRVTRHATTDPGVTTVSGRRGGWVAAGIGAYLTVAVGVPLLALLTAAVTPAAGVTPVPSNWTLSNFASVLNERTVAAFTRSLVLAALAASVLVVLGSCVAALERGRGGRLAATAVTLTLVLPGSTLAVSLLLSYGRWLGGTSAIILLAYVAKLWTFAHRPVSGAVDRLPPDELRASRVSGATQLTSWRTVLLRPLAPALVSAWLVCFVTGLHEVTMSSLLYGPGSETLAVVVLNSQELGQVGLTAALSLLLTVVLLVPALLLWQLVRRLGVSRTARVHRRGMASAW